MGRSLHPVSRGHHTRDMKILYLDELVDEFARLKKMASILRQHA